MYEGGFKYMREADMAGSNVDPPAVHEPLPPEYMVDEPAPDPWHTEAACQHDFILIAEFSEQEGPKPLITIPKDAGGCFDLNEFSVRIMSVDFQGVPSSDNFSLMEDTQVVLSETKDGIHAYVHHFTLYDYQARGFVRPFCMSYVTTDHRKLISFNEEMSVEFAKVSRYFKYGNLMLFVRDMTHYLTDLQYTRERFLEREEEGGAPSDLSPSHALQDPMEEAIFRSLNLAGIDSCIHEVKEVLEAASNLLTDKRMEARFQKLEDRWRQERVAGLSSTSSQNDALLESSSLSSSLRSSSLSSSFRNSSPRLGKGLFSRKEHRSGSFSDVDYSSCGLSPDMEMYKPKLVRTMNRRRFDHALRTLHELCQWGAREGLNRLRSIHKYFGREAAILDIERRESHMIDPPYGLLTIGRNVALNFMQNIDLECAGSCWSLGGPGCTARINHPILRKWLSDDTLASFKSAESFLSCLDGDSSLVTATSSYEAAFILGDAFVGERDSIGSFEEITPLRDIAEADPSCNRLDVSLSGSVEYITERSAEGSVNFTDSESLEEDEVVANGGLFLRDNMSIDNFPIDCQDSRSQRAHVSVISAADHVVNLGPSYPGYGILSLLYKFSFMSHMVYCLLSGRPLVVVGSSKLEKDIKAVVNALWLFVPGHSSRTHVVVPWHTRPLRLTDLSRMKIIGLCRPDKRGPDYMIPMSVKRYVSIFDLEKKTLITPHYQGGILNGICNKRKTIKDEKVFIAYIHSVLLELSNKAHIFYHALCVNPPKLQPSEYRTTTGPVQLMQNQDIDKVSIDLLAKLKITGQDVDIIKYFVEIIKQQQLEEFHLQQNPEQELPSPPIQLDHTKSSLYKA